MGLQQENQHNDEMEKREQQSKGPGTVTLQEQIVLRSCWGKKPCEGCRHLICSLEVLQDFPVT